jgi:hypothetical protein
VPRTTMRRAGTVALTSFATLTLLPLLVPARPSERVLLLFAAVPAAVLLGYIAGCTAQTGPNSHDERLQEIQQHIQQLQAAQRSAVVTVQPAAPVVTVVSEPVPGPGTGSPIGGGHLATLARPPADQLRREVRSGLHLVQASGRGAVTTDDAPTDASPGGLDESSPHLTLIVTQPSQHLTS